MTLVKIINFILLVFCSTFLFGFFCHALPNFRPLLYLSIIVVIVVCSALAIEDAGKVNGYYRASIFAGWFFKGFMVLLLWCFTVGIGWWLYLPNPLEEARQQALEQQRKEKQQQDAEDIREAIENAP